MRPILISAASISLGIGLAWILFSRQSAPSTSLEPAPATRPPVSAVTSTPPPPVAEADGEPPALTEPQRLGLRAKTWAAIRGAVGSSPTPDGATAQREIDGLMHAIHQVAGGTGPMDLDALDAREQAVRAHVEQLAGAQRAVRYHFDQLDAIDRP